jgi:hypothetical protein
MRSQALVLGLLITAGGMSLGMGLLGACSSVNAVSDDAGPPAAPVCLTDVAKQNGESCEAPSGYLCMVGFPCAEPPPQQALCTCTSGKWQCSYSAGDGGVIAPGSTPVCESYGHGMQTACPKNESPNAACSVAGIICSYAGETCPGNGFANTDTCQCVSGPDAGLQFVCDRDLCDPLSDVAVPPPPDTGAPDTGPDAHDGGSDSAG